MFLTERFAFFNKLKRELEQQGFLKSAFVYSDSSLHQYRCFEECNVLYLNTSVICNSDQDRGNLIIGNCDLYLTLKKITEVNPDKPIIILAHHGIDNFREDEKKAVERLFEQYPVLLYLCGDSHKSWRRQVNNLLEITMGGLIQGNGVRTVFSIGKLKDGEYSIEAHEWDADEGEWEEYLSFNKSLRKWKLSQPSTPFPLVEIVTQEHPVFPSAYFLGRDTYLLDIKHILQKERKIVLLSGMGGIGKSEICRQLFEHYTVTVGSHFIKKIGWVTYQDTLQTSFYGQFANINSDDVEEYWQKAKQYMNQEGRNLLIIVDNANTISMSETLELMQLSCNLLLTARKELDRIKLIEIECLSMEDCCELYRQHSKDRTAPDITIEGIISLAARHTLAVELLAKTQYKTAMDAEELLQVLKQTGFDLSEIAEEVTYVHNPEREKENKAEQRFIEHMATIFDISEIKEEKEELRILQLFSLLASNTPVEIKRVKKWFALDNLKALNSVVEKGWLIRSNQNGKQVISMHSVIATVIRNRAMPPEEIAEVLIEKMADALSLEDTEVFVDKLDILVHATAIINTLSMECLSYAQLLNNISIIYYKQRVYGTALECYGKALVISERVLGKDHPNTANIYNNVALVYADQREYEKALEWYEKALIIYEKRLGKNYPATKIIYDNMINSKKKIGRANVFSLFRKKKKI